LRPPSSSLWERLIGSSALKKTRHSTKIDEGELTMAVDETKLQELMGKLLGDAGAAMGIGLVLLGDKFGLYKTLAAAGPLTPAELASRTGTAARSRERMGGRASGERLYQFRLRDRAIFDFARAGAGLCR
jgi:hypothetical protein